MKTSGHFQAPPQREPAALSGNSSEPETTCFQGKLEAPRGFEPRSKGFADIESDTTVASECPIKATSPKGSAEARPQPGPVTSHFDRPHRRWMLPMKYAPEGDACRIVLCDRNGEVNEALIDIGDLELVRGNGCRWYVRYDASARTHYVRNSDGVMLHRLILGAPKGTIVDHKDYNGLNNRRENIRLVTNAENIRRARGKRIEKTSSFRGVNWDNRLHKWRSQIKVDWQTVYLGMFASEELAAQAYDAAAIKFHGDFAMPNFPVNEVHP